MSLDDDFSPATLKKIVYNYIPNEFLPTQWFPKKKESIDNLQDLLNNSNGKLRMFESANMLMQALEVYTNFPRSFHRFNVECSDLLSNIPTIYESLKSEEYIYKSDMYNVLYRNSVVSCPLPALETQLIMESVAIYMKTKESKLRATHEMIQIPVEAIKILSSKIKTANLDLYQEPAGFNSTHKEFDVDDVFGWWKAMLHLDENDEDSEKQVLKILKTFAEEIPARNENLISYARITLYTSIVVEEFEKFINENPNVFLDRTQSETSELPIRLFSDQKENFVMAHELLESMKNAQMDVSSFEEEVLGMPKLATFTFREVLQKVDREAMKNITFVKVPIASSKLRATPIPTIDGGYCILASDGFFEILCDMVTVKKVFQIIEKSQWKIIEAFFKSLEQYFKLSNGIYFIDLKDISLIKAEWDKCFERISIGSKVPKEVREVRNRDRKFSVEYVKKELKYLNLHHIFPDIINIANEILENIPNLKNANNFQTCIMYDVIELCQFNCIFKRFSKMQQFVHSQNACSENESWQCEECFPKTQGTSSEIMSVKEDVKKTSETKIVDSEVNLDSEKTLKTIEKDSHSNEISSTNTEESSEISSGADSTTNEETSDSSSKRQKETSESHAVEKKQKTKKMKKQKSSKNNLDSADDHQSEKESNSCAKCFRTSEFQMKTAEELRLTKVETKHLKKTLSELELENEKAKKREIQKNTRLQELERQLLSQEQKLAENEEKIKNLEIQQEVLKKENAEKDERIRIVENYARSQERKVLEQNEIIRNLQTAPSTSSESPSLRSPEESNKVKDVFNKLLNIQDTLHIENPFSKASEVANRLKMKSENQEVKQIARSELRVFHRQCQFYIKSVEKNLQMIRSNPAITVVQIPTLPEFPSFSEEFTNAYKETMKSDAPKICESLLNSFKNPESQDAQELADKECLICISDIELNEETIKCKCRRRFHTECASEWFKVKRVCPACDAGLLDPIEFPSL